MYSILDQAHLLGALFYYGPFARETKAIIANINDESPLFAGLSIDVKAWKIALHESDIDLTLAWQNQFIGPQHLAAPPWGSIYLDPECIVFGESTLALKSFLQQCQLQLDTGKNEPEDHLGLLLLALVILLQKEDINNAKLLLAEHILPWGIYYLELLHKNSLHSFISRLAQDTKVFLENCSNYYQLEPIEKKIYWYKCN